MKWKRITIILLTIILCLTFAGCNGQEKTAEYQEEKKELTVWTFFDMNTPDSYYVDLWDTLAEEYGYRIDVKTYSTQQIKDKLRVALACGELPDIFLVWGGNYPNYLFDAGACIPVQDYLDASDYHPKQSYTEPYRDGNRYIIPCLVEAYAVTYCNEKLLDQMGLKIPETWEELVSFVKAVNVYNEKNHAQYVAIELGDKDNWLGELLYCMIVNRIDPNALDRLISGEAKFSDDVFVEAAKKVRKLVKMGAFPEDFLETGEVEAVENFVNEEAVLFPHQSTIVYYLMKQMGEDGFSVQQFPDCGEVQDDDYSSYLMDINHTLTPGLCISSKSVYQEEAAELCIAFAKRVNEINVTEYGYLDMTTDRLEPPKENPKPVQQFRDMVQNAEKFTADWYALLPEQEGDDWRNLTKKLFAGEVSVEQFITEGEKCLNFVGQNP